MREWSLCVYCGSRFGEDPAFQSAAQATGRAIAARSGRLVYGGGHVGLMGAVADAALAAGAKAVGVIPEAIMQREVGHRTLTELHVVTTMHERKMLMAEQSDAFITLPGGIGTMEEMFEMWSWQQLGYHDKPIGLLNVNGYYDALIAFINTGKASDFLSDAQHQALMIDTDVDRLVDRLWTASHGRQALRSDYSKT